MFQRNQTGFLYGMLFLFLFVCQPSSALKASQPFTIIQDPDGTSLLVETPLNLTIRNNLEIAISSVLLHYCSLEPVFICHFPSLQLERNVFGFFSIEFIPEYEAETILGFNFEIKLENGTLFNIPDCLDYSDVHSIRKASDDLFYFSINIVDTSTPPTTSITSNQVSGFHNQLILFLLLPLIVKKKKKI
ncbi:hypothetical protein CEE45_12915 [Candidatus Heimdallarchaeota archaeon B3_Heim]|nr:MAG: hypothetical protein CEE45_12915 [Candidatus Heimdallarchaeota archaeon B3_Heim]